MILIISQYNESSTNEIIDWLYSYGLEFYRINPFDPIRVERVKLNQSGEIDAIFSTANGHIINLKEVDFLLYRNGFYKLEYKHKAKKNISHLEDAFLDGIKNEFKTLDDFIKFISSKVANLISINFAVTNKLQNLMIASTCGFNVPASIITSNKKEMIAFYNECGGKVICKPMAERPFAGIYNGKKFIGYTEALEMCDILKMPEHFFPIFLQKHIDSEFEVRVFFIEQLFYSMAIFNFGKQLDYRNFSGTNPNRFVRYEISEAVKTSISKLSCELCLKTGSIDLICDNNGELFFLELNPVGQYISSYPCQYFIEKEIADYIKSKICN